MRRYAVLLGRFKDLFCFNFVRKRKMDVTRHNFKSLLPDIEEAIRTASFICIDGEFTGLNAYRGISPFDLPDQRYDKLQESARQFLLMQFGLCTFHYDEKSDSYSNQAYNFYVWPRPCSRQAPDPRFLCQTSSLDFLISQNFDFNRLFRDGISYLRPAELEKLRAATLERQEYRRNNMNTPEQKIAIPADQEAFLSTVCDKLDDFIKSEERTIEIDRCNSFQRRLVYQTAREKFPSLSLSGLTRPGGERVISVSKDTDNQKKLADLQDQTEIADIEEAFGFSKVIQIISESQKLVIGHNMVLDVCHTLNQFCHPLPETYMDFKDMVSTVFPNIIDTKLMANTIPFKEEIYNSSLSELFRIVSEKPYVMPTISARKYGCGYTEADDKYHEAGYDAFITGLCFISMHRRLTKLCGSKPRGVDAETMEIKPFLNKLYLMKVSDIPYMNLGGEDIMPERSHVFYLSIPREWKTPDVALLFAAYGGVNVFWVNDTSVFVSLKERSWSTNILKEMKSSGMFEIHSYDSYLQGLQKERERSLLGGNAQSSAVLPVKPDTLDTNGQAKKRSANSGITPTLERTFGSGVQEEREKKRPVSPEPKTTFKRSKSVVEDKAFEEPPWD